MSLSRRLLSASDPGPPCDGRSFTKIDVGDIDRNEDRIWNCGAVRFPAKSPPLRCNLDSREILVLGQVMRDRGTAGDRRAVIHLANQALVVDVENLLGAMRRNVIWKHDAEPPPSFAVRMPR